MPTETPKRDLAFEPQTKTRPDSVTAADCSIPSSISTTFSPMSEATNRGLMTGSPLERTSPSLPEFLSPHTYSWPLEERAAEW